MKIVIVTNGPVPYRIPALNELATQADVDLHVLYCCGREPNRDWNLPPIEYHCTYLRERITKIKDRYIHNNPDVIPALKRLQPDVVITSGFNPTHLYAFLYAWLTRIPHISMTDGTYDSEKALTILHRWARRFVYARSKAFLWASIGGRKLFESYGIPLDRCFRSCLCVENTKFSQSEPLGADLFDFIFCGRIESVKNPHFAFDVALAAAARLKRKTRIMYVGAGSEEQALKKRVASCEDQVEASFHGFAQQEELPQLYRSSRIFLFPSKWDPWGVVANEACAAGIPVLVSPHAGVAGELVIDGQNGYVCDLDVSLWADRAVELLTRPDIYRTFSERSRSLVSNYTFADACAGIAAACRFATSTDGI
ncbi:glycosyltransferase family 4 protein [Massilia sp. LXY-6]|uniref:glycosyltransferase family 4 protein n=1 Tax=Massilia sp. LXY-6 TaxID=3379823 RepID=UPI003EE2DED6